MKKKPKSLGQVAYEARPMKLECVPISWEHLDEKFKANAETAAKAVERAVLSRLKREGKL